MLGAFVAQQLEGAFAAQHGHVATGWSPPGVVPAHPASPAPSFGFWQQGRASEDPARFLAAQQLEPLLTGDGRLAFRNATRRRTCSGGSMPFASAQASFSSSVKQQQSPAQQCLALVHPQGRYWQG
jgi:hypothetical protein